MPKHLAGMLIRGKRMEMGWSQEGLCKGICAVSYLSKIEQGKTEPGKEILSLLFFRLGLCWHQEPDFIEKANALFDDCYDALFAGENYEKAYDTLLKNKQLYCNSPYFIDYLLITSHHQNLLPSDMHLYLPAMNEKQYGLFLYLSKAYEDLLRSHGNAYYYTHVGLSYYTEGKYGRAIELLNHGYRLASEEGYITLMMDARIILGNCYSDLRQLDTMVSHYQVAKRLARAVGNLELLETIPYNLAASYLENGDYQKAYGLLIEYPQTGTLYWHKLAICQEQMGEREQALDSIQRAESAPTCSMPPALKDKICALVRFRLEHENYLELADYGNMLTKCFADISKELPRGYALFHLPWMEEWYLANRKYKQAYDLLNFFHKER